MKIGLPFLIGGVGLVLVGAIMLIAGTTTEITFRSKFSSTRSVTTVNGLHMMIPGVFLIIAVLWDRYSRYKEEINKQLQKDGHY